VTLSTGFSSCPYCRGEGQVEKRDNGQEAEVGTGGALTEFRGGRYPIGCLADHFEGVSMLWWTGLQADRHEMEDKHATV
jgi:hypothetical protein